MGCTEATAKTSVYRPSNPHSSPLYQCVRKHYEEVVGLGVVHRRVEEQALTRFIDCGDLRKGFVSNSERYGMCQFSKYKSKFIRYTFHYYNEQNFIQDLIRICVRDLVVNKMPV